ncbi:hypothetical protein [Natrarchaeobius halalkaliphilus]|uniref:hypothetical protein n=1 Tax=Natrarchaeobius halalkaliphilus TaxID=1679091 RepID=UPI000F54AACD|nr:hypothetical protein [Natrarchaeobius halalkaliphilus]
MATPEPQTLQDIYNRAEYFLGQAKETETDDEVRWNLSAFLTAVYSLEGVLRDEFNIKNWISKQKNLDLYEYIRENRTVTDHVGAPATYPTARPALTTRYGSGDGRGFIFEAPNTPGDRNIHTSQIELEKPPRGALSGESISPEDREKRHKDQTSSNDHTIESALVFHDLPNQPVPEQYNGVPAIEVCCDYLSLLQDYLNDWREISTTKNSEV